MRTSFLAKHRILSIAAITLILASVGCDIHGSVELNGSNHGHINYKVTARTGFSFSAAGSSSLSTPQFSIDFQGFPYNRVVLIASTLTTNSDGSTTATPMQLVPGSSVPANVSIGSFYKAYNTSIEVSSDLPAGSYVLNAPGMVMDIQTTLQGLTNTSMTIVIPASYFSSAMLVNSSSIVAIEGYGIESGDLTITFTSDQLQPWQNLTIEPINHPGPSTPTLGD